METISHASIFKRYKAKISVTFVLLTLEYSLTVLEPLAIGLAINGLVEQSWSGLILFVLIEAAMIATGYVRRRYDTRTYGKIYATLSNREALRAIGKDDDLSPAIGRAGLLKEVIDFFENELPMSLQQVFSILGALVMLLILSPYIGLVSVASAILIGLIYFLSRNHIKSLNARLNDELEARTRKFMARDADMLKGHFADIVKFSVGLSDIEARNFGLSHLFVAFLIAYALYETVAVQGANVGDVFTVIMYVSQFAGGVLILPFMYQQYLRTSEITGRLGADENEQEVQKAKEPQ